MAIDVIIVRRRTLLVKQKLSVTLLDNIDAIVVGSDREKQRLLEVFRRRKVMKLPDGRKVEDVVLVR